MILVDTSVWVEHLRARNKALVKLLEDGQVLTHPFVIGELALGHLQPRDVILNALSDLPRARSATDDEVLHLIDREGLAGLGIGYVDAHLLAAVRLTAAATLWTRNKRLHQVADRMGVAAAQRTSGRSGCVSPGTYVSRACTRQSRATGRRRASTTR